MVKIKQVIRNFVVQNKAEFITLVIILLIASILRLYRINDYLTFLGDEGRDAIIVRRLLLYADPILIGPGTSIGNMYLGPLYYYFMAPWLWLFNFSPVGPAVGVALLSILTVWFVWYCGREWFGKIAGITGAFLYAISPVVIIYSRSSWNPNIMPFFALLSVWSVWKIWMDKKYIWLIVLGFAFAFVLQSHYLGLLLAPLLFVFYLVALKNAKKGKERKQLLTYSFLGAGLFLLLMSPLVIFDARHGWRNLDSIKKFFFERQTTVSAKPWNALPKLLPLSEKIFSRLVSAKNQLYGNVSVLLMLIPLFWLFDMKGNHKLKKNEKWAFIFLLTWVLFALLGLGLYKQEIYDHYYGFFFTAPFLLLGGVFQIIWNKSRIRGASLVIVAVFLLSIVNLMDNPLRYAPNRQLPRTREVAEKIIEVSEGNRFNLAVIAERNYDDAYQYFLEAYNAKLIDIDPQKTGETITKQLFVVCEMPADKCNPTNSPKAEVANFGWSKVDKTWEVSGVTLFKLIHSQ